MATLPTATSRARSLISRCLTAGVVLITIGYGSQALVERLVADVLPIAAALVLAVVMAVVKVAGPAVLAIGIVGVGVQLGLAAYGVRPALPSEERAP